MKPFCGWHRQDTTSWDLESISTTVFSTIEFGSSPSFTELDNENTSSLLSTRSSPRTNFHFFTMAYENSLNEKKDLKFDNSSADKIEDVSESEHAQQLAELSAIEAIAASKAAWLISITVSLGGLLFGTTN